MKRLLAIDDCVQCPWYNFDWEELQHVCRKEQRELPDGDGIPDWCPLPEAAEAAGGE